MNKARGLTSKTDLWPLHTCQAHCCAWIQTHLVTKMKSHVAKQTEALVGRAWYSQYYISLITTGSLTRIYKQVDFTFLCLLLKTYQWDRLLAFEGKALYAFLPTERLTLADTWAEEPSEPPEWDSSGRQAEPWAASEMFPPRNSSPRTEWMRSFKYL